MVCVYKEQSLTGRLSEADGVPVDVRWEDERRRRTLKGRSMQTVNTLGGLLPNRTRCSRYNLSSPDLPPSDLIPSHVLNLSFGVFNLNRSAVRPRNA